MVLFWRFQEPFSLSIVCSFGAEKEKKEFKNWYNILRNISYGDDKSRRYWHISKIIPFVEGKVGLNWSTLMPWWLQSRLVWQCMEFGSSLVWISGEMFRLSACDHKIKPTKWLTLWNKRDESENLNSLRRCHAVWIGLHTEESGTACSTKILTNMLDSRINQRIPKDIHERCLYYFVIPSILKAEFWTTLKPVISWLLTN